MLLAFLTSFNIPVRQHIWDQFAQDASKIETLLQLKAKPSGVLRGFL